MPITTAPQTATVDDAPQISRILARAFVDDPMMLSFFTEDATREASLTRYFSTLFTRQYLLHGLCERTASAASFWVPTEAQEKAVPDADTIAELRNILGDRAEAFGAAVETAARLAPQEPHWSLSLVGADPDARGQGHGAALLRSGLAQADAAGQPVYLESSKPSNVPFYEHFGFTVREEFPLPGGGPTLWGMWREPHPVR
ncbi:GNAT family N-acetyltransferase [Streptomyces sp. NBC_00237]|uniref:GNAT family N-acetyltransferase n=1 Tax=Streptomyces sp. NBC_00237 TaxID=2975687 RepID=UPI00225B0D1F|nr:GNAT family N-acetyltransferase [Streptomyces sp. NBC_00237]MCX5205326.1 GNAT family N-acetyltransferase [Streptomyces sp. NBC_00237]